VAGKTQLVDRIVARGSSRAAATAAVEAVLAEVTGLLASGERVTLTGFGSFDPVERAARTARNPRTGGRVDVPAARVVRFHAGAGLRSAVGGGAVPEGPPVSEVVPVAPRPDGEITRPSGKKPAASAAETKDAKPRTKDSTREPGSTSSVKRSGTTSAERSAKKKSDDKPGKKSSTTKSGKKSSTTKSGKKSSTTKSGKKSSTTKSGKKSSKKSGKK
jgi:DNA-binding protein HU-beta